MGRGSLQWLLVDNNGSGLMVDAEKIFVDTDSAKCYAKHVSAHPRHLIRHFELTSSSCV